MFDLCVLDIFRGSSLNRFQQRHVDQEGGESVVVFSGGGLYMDVLLCGIGLEELHVPCGHVRDDGYPIVV